MPTQTEPARSNTQQRAGARPEVSTSAPSVIASARFLGQFIRRPGMIGAVAPSSAALAHRMVDGVDLHAARAVVEFGPGTGVFTREIVRRLGPSTRFFSVELNPELVARCRAAMPGVEFVAGSAAEVDSMCAQRGIAQLDVVVSGLPWASFPEGLQDAILSSMLRVLRPGGVFVTFAYGVGTWLPAGRRFYSKLNRLFAATHKSKYVWRNLPPAFVYRCVK